MNCLLDKELLNGFFRSPVDKNIGVQTSVITTISSTCFTNTITVTMIIFVFLNYGVEQSEVCVCADLWVF